MTGSRPLDEITDTPATSGEGAAAAPGFPRRRLARLFGPDGRGVIVALDHGAAGDVYPGLGDPGRTLDAVVQGGADAVLTTPGVLGRFGERLGRLGVILRLDGGSTALRPGTVAPRLLLSVADALRLGADAVACMGFPGTPWEAETLANVAKLAGQCQRWNVPLMAEMLPGGFGDPALHTAANVRLAARLGAELGADVIKTKFVGDTRDFRQVTAHCYRPVLVLGGSKTDDLAGLFTMVETAMAAGACGVVIGRNVWAHESPRAVVQALCRMVHGGASAEAARQTLAAGRGER
jgi:class I fructose-bisphosphate aldolase